MPSHGGTAPAPRRMGGGTPYAKIILDALIAARGTAINAGDESSVAYVETVAIARAIAAAWATNQRLANQWDARRMTSMLSRWERIFGLSPAADATLSSRRHQVELAQARVGQGALLTAIHAELSDALGDALVGVEFISLANAVITVPTNTYPFGVVVPNNRAPWSSSVSHVLVRVQALGTESEFYDLVKLVGDRMEPLLPAWATWDWYREPLSGGVFVDGGPSAGGFFLDDEHNLDNNVFDDSTDLEPPIPNDAITTEDGELINTEGGEYIVTES